MERTERNIQKDILGVPMNEKAAINLIHSNPETAEAFRQLGNEAFRENVVDFVRGQKGAKVSYDPVFKYLFNPEVHPERLSDLLSALMGEKVKVKRALPNESNRLCEAGSLLVLDILVELETGELANVEMQRIGYAFPGQRGACYSSDLMMRQYSRIKSGKESKFVYRDLKQVYTIVLLEKSTAEFYKLPKQYIHRAKQTFDTGLELDLLQQFIFVGLDIFQKNVHNIDKELDAWLYFLSSDDPAIIGQIVTAFPKFQELYDDLAKFRTDPKELIAMYSEALRILDFNTTRYMFEEQQKEIEANIKALAVQGLALAEKDSALAEKDSALAEKDSALAEKDSALAEQYSALANKDREIELLKFQLQHLQEE